MLKKIERIEKHLDKTKDERRTDLAFERNFGIWQHFLMATSAHTYSLFTRSQST
jgi:hypothetical protein